MSTCFTHLFHQLYELIVSGAIGYVQRWFTLSGNMLFYNKSDLPVSEYTLMWFLLLATV